MTADSLCYLSVIDVPIDQQAISNLLGITSEKEAERIYSEVSKSISIAGHIQSKYRWPNIFDILMHETKSTVREIGTHSAQEQCAVEIADLVASVVSALDEESLTWHTLIADPSGLLLTLNECKFEICDICEEHLQTGHTEQIGAELFSRIRSIFVAFNDYLLSYWGIQACACDEI
ncbi:hypothetical protein GCM10010991_37810 [Gemmobacter aquaticus]|uniref:Uncharacterized protein n=1 Tax=Gemmobacter aquaticus TaxID=490185 RepID=A0A918DEP1_9RHOB|nr:hypothetical protein [Gemmobacter aquaticus]GGO39243.1 hypothetical protein GCM10010991_37810 [Gemmobacter aquaticus]